MARKLAIILLAALAALLLGACASGNRYDQAAIEAATRQRIAADGSDVAIDRVEIEKTSGDYVRALAIPADPNSVDPAYVFLRREGDSWTVLNYGTAFSPENYREDKIPEALWLGN